MAERQAVDTGPQPALPSDINLSFTRLVNSIAAELREPARIREQGASRESRLTGVLHVQREPGGWFRIVDAATIYVETPMFRRSVLARLNQGLLTIHR